jgi:hypothetical protein
MGDGLAGPARPRRRLPSGGRCEVCGARAREVAIYQTPVGVFCAVVCDSCVAAGKAPPVRSWSQAVWRVGAHCQHLGIDLDQMADILEAELNR